jgi:hypothetical protein
VPKKKGLVKKYRFRQKVLKIVPRGKSLAKRYTFSHEKIEDRWVRGWQVEPRCKLIG